MAAQWAPTDGDVDMIAGHVVDRPLATLFASERLIRKTLGQIAAGHLPGGLAREAAARVLRLPQVIQIEEQTGGIVVSCRCVGREGSDTSAGRATPAPGATAAGTPPSPDGQARPPW